MPDRKLSLDEAYEICRTISVGHYENFPVGSFLIPKNRRKHFFALYAFMRTADDFADQPHRNKDERLKLLANWRGQLDLSVGRTSVRPVSSDGLKSVPLSETENPIFIALRNTIKECGLSTESLFRLLEAFEFDAKGEVQFETFDDLRWYTSRSADPVGELVLGLFGYKDQERIRLSNEICSALQLLNFIQDIKEDIENKRYYYPKEDCGIFAIDITEIPLNHQRLSLATLFELERVEALLDRGTPLAESVRGRLRYELRAIIISARKLISKLRKIDGNSYLMRPKLSKWEHFIVLLQSLMRRVD